MRRLMVTDDLSKLAALVKKERNTLLSQWRQQVRHRLHGARHLDTTTLNDHVPEFLDELAAALQLSSDETMTEAPDESGPSAHGLQRVRNGFDIDEVVAEYYILSDLIHDLANANGLSLQGRPFHAVSRLFERAIGLAVQAYATQQGREAEQHRRKYLAFVTHDLKTPLNAISLATKVLELKLNEPSTTAAQMLKILRRNVESLDRLVDQVREENANVSAEAGIALERRTFDLWPLVAAVIYDLQPVAGNRSTLLINKVPDDVVVYADAGLLKRIFQNLIANAIRYTPRGKVIIRARDLGNEAGVECWVSDNGVGTPEEVLEKVFGDKPGTDPQKEETAGLGLGLAVVRTFVEAHNGKVTVESKEGLGSRFRFTLPSKGI